MANNRQGCPPGKTRRRGYTRKNGRYVKSTCIRSTSKYAKPANNTTRRQENRLGRLLGNTKECPPGQIARKAYVRRITSRVGREGYNRKTKSGKTVRVYPKVKSVLVKSACVKDVGKPGKLPEGAPRIGPLRKGELKKYGYSYKLPENQRRAALQRAISKMGALNTYRKLNAVAKLSERAAPAASAAFGADRNWIKATYAAANGSLKAF